MPMIRTGSKTGSGSALKLLRIRNTWHFISQVCFGGDFEPEWCERSDPDPNPNQQHWSVRSVLFCTVLYLYCRSECCLPHSMLVYCWVVYGADESWLLWLLCFLIYWLLVCWAGANILYSSRAHSPLLHPYYILRRFWPAIFIHVCMLHSSKIC